MNMIAKKKKKDLKECMQYLLSAECKGDAARALREKFGIGDDEATGTMLLASALLSRALGGGDVPAVKEIRSIIDSSSQTQDKKLEIVVKTR